MDALVRSACDGDDDDGFGSSLGGGEEDAGAKKRKWLSFSEFVGVLDRVSGTIQSSSSSSSSSGGGGDDNAGDGQHGEGGGGGGAEGARSRRPPTTAAKWPLYVTLKKHFRPLATAGGGILELLRRVHKQEQTILTNNAEVRRILDSNRAQLGAIFRVYTRGMHSGGGGGGGSGGGNAPSSPKGSGGRGMPQRYLGSVGTGNTAMSVAGVLAFARDFAIIPDLLGMNGDKFFLAFLLWQHHARRVEGGGNGGSGGSGESGSGESRTGVTADMFVDMLGHIALRFSSSYVRSRDGVIRIDDLQASPGDTTKTAGMGGKGACEGGGGEEGGEGREDPSSPGPRIRSFLGWLEKGRGGQRVTEISGGTSSMPHFDL